MGEEEEQRVVYITVVHCIEEVCVLCVCVGEGGEEATEEVYVLCVCRRGRGRGN